MIVLFRSLITSHADYLDTTGSVLTLSDLNNSNAAFIGTVCLSSGFLLLALFVSIYYYRKRGLYHDFSSSSQSGSHKILLLKREGIPLEKPPYVIKKTPAVRSPSSSQVNPFNKKSPSPTTSPQQSSSGGFSRKYCEF